MGGENGTGCFMLCFTGLCYGQTEKPIADLGKSI